MRCAGKRQRLVSRRLDLAIWGKSLTALNFSHTHTHTRTHTHIQTEGGREMLWDTVYNLGCIKNYR